MVDQSCEYLTSVPVHPRNPRFARVLRGVLVYTERSPHEWGSSSRFYLLALSRPRHDNASFSVGLQQTSICSVTLVVGGRDTVYKQVYPFIGYYSVLIPQGKHNWEQLGVYKYAKHLVPGSIPDPSGTTAPPPAGLVIYPPTHTYP